MNHGLSEYEIEVAERSAELALDLYEHVDDDVPNVIVLEVFRLAARYPDKVRDGYTMQQFCNDLCVPIFTKDPPDFIKYLFDEPPL